MSIAAAAALAHCSTPFSTTDRTRRGYLRENARMFDGPPERPVIVVAGFGVTRLIDPETDRYVWGTPRSMWHTRYPDDLDLPAEGKDRLIPRGWVGSRGPVNIGWQLSIALQKYGGYQEGADLHPFFYDWRLSARDTSVQLAQLVEKVRGNGKVDIVAHSAGALVALAYVKLRGGEHVENLILIAPASGGVVDAFRVFVRPEKLIRREFKPEVVATWPFIFELLPEEGRVFVDEQGRPLERDLWDPGAWPFDVRHQLTNARTLREELRSTPANTNVTVLAGDCVPTATKILQRGDGTYAFYPDDLRPHEKPLAKLLFEPGDGTIPVSSARSAGEPALFCDGHQGIAADPNVHRALVRRLRR
ncbi:MAG TPA: alpha/beta fold hydrolase [Thermoanaerobaculia bacterium]